MCPAIVLGLLLIGSFLSIAAHRLSPDRIVFQTGLGELHFATYPDVAPLTSAHIQKLAKLGAYNTVNFFRVDKGFVAQVTDIRGNRLVPLNKEQETEANKNVPLEVTPEAKHDRRGILSMARWDDPNSGAASFSVTLGPAPHLDMHYTVFGEVTGGWETLDEFEKQPTKTEGIFVMPKDPILIQSTYVYSASGGAESSRNEACEVELAKTQIRLHSLAEELQQIRAGKLPG